MKTFIFGFIFSMSFSWTIQAAPQIKGVMAQPCQVAIPTTQQLQMDFGQLCKYEGANAALPTATNHRVVYFGDSITEFWGNRVPGLAPDDVINRGISGQTTAQMLVRFKADVLDLHPRVLHLLAGTNDIAGNTGPTSIKRIEEALASMAEQASAQGIRVVMASILPVKNYPWSPDVDSVTAIAALNLWMRQYAASREFIYLDYFSHLVDGQNGFQAGFCIDGVHPNDAGYAVMAPLAQDAIQRAMKTP